MWQKLFSRKPGPLPDHVSTFLEIASSNACNLSCVYCYGLGHPEPAKFDRAVYSGLLDTLLPHVDILVPSAGSEPFSADIEIAVTKVVEYGKRILLITNGTYPLGPVLRRLLNHIYRLQISIDSHKPTMYERMRPGARFETVLASLRDAVSVLRETNEIHRLVVSIVLTRENADTVPETVIFFRNEGVEAFLIQELYRFDSRLDIHQPAAAHVTDARNRLRTVAHESKCDILFAHPPVQRFTGRPISARPVEWDPERIIRQMEEYPGHCWQAGEWLKIHPNGEVHPCCVAPPELVLGNVNKTDILEILANGRREALQRAFERGNPPQACRSCPLLRQISTLPESF